jgi:hypothetical protein
VQSRILNQRTSGRYCVSPSTAFGLPTLTTWTDFDDPETLPLYDIHHLEFPAKSAKMIPVCPFTRSHSQF